MTKIIIPVVAFLILLLGFFKVNFFRINNVLIHSDADCVNGDLNNDLKLNGRSIFYIGESDLLSRLSLKYLCIGNLKVEKKFPTTVLVTVQGRKPVLNIESVNFASGSADFLASSSAEVKTAYLVDLGGFLFEEGERADLPQIYDQDDQLKVGVSLGEEVVNIVSIENKLKELGLTAAESTLEGDDLFVKSDNPSSIIFSLKNDVKTELASLQLILQAGKMNSEDASGGLGGPKPMERIDLRFDKPVIVYSAKRS
jgi:hypothetical protein